jgi:hypothetical protein
MTNSLRAPGETCEYRSCAWVASEEATDSSKLTSDTYQQLGKGFCDNAFVGAPKVVAFSENQLMQRRTLSSTSSTKEEGPASKNQ